MGLDDLGRSHNSVLVGLAGPSDQLVDRSGCVVEPSLSRQEGDSATVRGRPLIGPMRRPLQSLDGLASRFDGTDHVECGLEREMEREDRVGVTKTVGPVQSLRTRVVTDRLEVGRRSGGDLRRRRIVAGGAFEQAACLGVPGELRLGDVLELGHGAVHGRPLVGLDAVVHHALDLRVGHREFVAALDDQRPAEKVLEIGRQRTDAGVL